MAKKAGKRASKKTTTARRAPSAPRARVVSGPIVRLSESGPGGITYVAPGARVGAGPARRRGGKRGGGGGRGGFVDKLIHTVTKRALPITVGSVGVQLLDRSLEARGISEFWRNILLVAGGTYIIGRDGAYTDAAGTMAAIQGLTRFLLPGAAPAGASSGWGLGDLLKGFINPMLKTGGADGQPGAIPPAPAKPFKPDDIKKVVQNYTPAQKTALKQYLQPIVMKGDGYRQWLEALD